jgi:hypothetical protein
MSNKQKIAICLFGVIRNTEKCIPSFYQNIVEPLEKIYDVSIYFHIYKLKEINSGRSNENSRINESAYDFLKKFKGILEESTEIDENYAQIIFSKGDPFFNNFHSCKNLFRQLLSVNKVYNEAKQDNPLAYLFLRPDLEYVNKVDVLALEECIKKDSRIVIPFWQWWGGMNDRFAICGRKAAETYASRYYRLSEFCIGQANMMHAEKLVKYVVRKDKLSLRVTNMKANRVRVNGEYVDESFSLFTDTTTKKALSKLNYLFSVGQSILGKIRDRNLVILFWRYWFDIKSKSKSKSKSITNED